MDGTEFDSSYQHGQPATFGVAAVIAGWREALPLMPVGLRWQLVVPPDLAYGERDAWTQGPRLAPDRRPTQSRLRCTSAGRSRSPSGRRALAARTALRGE